MSFLTVADKLRPVHAVGICKPWETMRPPSSAPRDDTRHRIHLLPHRRRLGHHLGKRRQTARCRRTRSTSSSRASDDDGPASPSRRLGLALVGWGLP